MPPVQTNQERILLVGDAQHQVQSALATAFPGSVINPAPTCFDAIAELAANPYTAVLAAAQPIERRPESAVQTLRRCAGDARIILFGEPSLEPLSRKMLDFGCDDYIVWPASTSELQQLFSAPMRIASPGDAEPADEAPRGPSPTLLTLRGLPMAEICLDALIHHPAAAPAAAMRRFNELLGATGRLAFVPAGGSLTEMAEGRLTISHPVREGESDAGHLHLILPHDEDSSAARHFLSRLATLVGKLHGLQQRHNGLQRLAVTDELTGLYNARWFKHFLSQIIEKAKRMRFPVTLLLFDIDDFKRYNDQYGHGIGDEILKQTASLMRRCCREHDLVARIGGDEFAVVFWEKEGPRQPRQARPGGVTVASRPPQTPLQVFERFRKLIATQSFRGLGSLGKGVLTISAGLAVYPYDARDMEELVRAADQALMFGAKKAGKNSIFLVGDEPPMPPAPPAPSAPAAPAGPADDLQRD